MGASVFNLQGRKGTYIPHNDTSIVANLKDLMKGAIAMDPANIRCDKVHVVTRSGLYFANLETKGAILAGGLGVNCGLSSCGRLDEQWQHDGSYE